jgi:hypothetical protein
MTYLLLSISRNGNDFRGAGRIDFALAKQAAVFAQRAKVLNLCGDSNCRVAVTFHTTVQNKFINRLRSSAAERNFRTVVAAMPISDYANALFFARRNRVTLGNARSFPKDSVRRWGNGRLVPLRA